MRNKKIRITILLAIVILLLGGLLVIGVFQLAPHVQSAKLCSMINAGSTESAIEYIEKIGYDNIKRSEKYLRRYLINEGIKNDFLYVTGSPMKEVLYKNMIPAKEQEQYERSFKKKIRKG